MNIEINSKYNVGDIVQIYREVGVYDREIDCPLCKGKYIALNPNYIEGSEEHSELLICNCCKHGRIKISSRMEKRVHPEKYKITGLNVSVDEAIDITIRYNLESLPQLNGRKGIYKSTCVDEDTIALKVDTSE